MTLLDLRSETRDRTLQLSRLGTHVVIINVGRHSSLGFYHGRNETCALAPSNQYSPFDPAHRFKSASTTPAAVSTILSACILVRLSITSRAIAEVLVLFSHD